MSEAIEAPAKRRKVDTVAAMKEAEREVGAARSALDAARENQKAARAATAQAMGAWSRAHPAVTINTLVAEIGQRRAERINAEKEAGLYTPRPGLTDALMRRGKTKKLPSHR